MVRRFLTEKNAGGHTFFSNYGELGATLQSRMMAVKILYG